MKDFITVLIKISLNLFIFVSWGGAQALRYMPGLLLDKTSHGYPRSAQALK
jgi:hypothetical protein